MVNPQALSIQVVGHTDGDWRIQCDGVARSARHGRISGETPRQAIPSQMLVLRNGRTFHGHRPKIKKGADSVGQWLIGKGCDRL